jgi:hypothetical protein
VSSSQGLRILGPMRALISPSGSILVSLPLCLKLENFIIYVSLCNSRIHVITLYSGHVCVYYASMLWCWHLVWILVRTDLPFLGVGCHKLIPDSYLLHKPFDHSIRFFFAKFTRKRIIIITRNIIITRESIFITCDILGRGMSICFYLILPSLAMRHVCLGRFGKSDLLDEDLPSMAMVDKSSLSD